MATTNLKQRIEALTKENRTLKEKVRVYDLNYCYLRDLLNDARFAIRLGRPLDPSLIDELMNFQWKEDGHMVELSDSQRTTAFSRETAHAPEPGARVAEVQT